MAKFSPEALAALRAAAQKATSVRYEYERIAALPISDVISLAAKTGQETDLKDADMEAEVTYRISYNKDGEPFHKLFVPLTNGLTSEVRASKRIRQECLEEDSFPVCNLTAVLFKIGEGRYTWVFDEHLEVKPTREEGLSQLLKHKELKVIVETLHKTIFTARGWKATAFYTIPEFIKLVGKDHPLAKADMKAKAVFDSEIEEKSGEIFYHLRVPGKGKQTINVRPSKRMREESVEGDTFKVSDLRAILCTRGKQVTWTFDVQGMTTLDK